MRSVTLDEEKLFLDANGNASEEVKARRAKWQENRTFCRFRKQQDANKTRKQTKGAGYLSEVQATESWSAKADETVPKNKRKKKMKQRRAPRCAT